MTRDTHQSRDRRDASDERTPRQQPRGGAKGAGDAYSDIEDVSQRVGKIVIRASESIHVIRSSKRSGERLSPESETNLRTDVMTAVTLVRTELENDRDRYDVYDAILSRWDGEEGFINKFEQMDVRADGDEPWLRQFAADIHRAGWELGYLKSGTESGITEKPRKL